ncbi:PEP-CTERM sorting domain-containing protein [Anabaena azotica]|uniref:PEP-CTERM sorting domain-containing protein n=1 Tax=Anabaena azotica FACHB-119 TaxID=947527 RepID=A0ABR8D1B9_9NOST|nr:PEP-CTERM sorting domain-containing protein [Anabaena azotica]MBD2500524.1 PEP-CTERM sorting domain-containing protein [Anabaena azotica FACHB-119]
MNLLTKVSLSAICSATALFVGVTSHINTAQAALYKFSFEGEGVNGYFIYDTSFPAFSEDTGVAAYIGAATEYKFELGEKGIFQGKVATPIVVLSREENGTAGLFGDGDVDTFMLQEHADEREPQTGFALVSYFIYPEGTFEESTAQRTTVPSTAFARIYPNVDYPNTLGEAAFVGTVQTRIEKVPEPALLPALLGVGAWFVFRRQHRQLLSKQD